MPRPADFQTKWVTVTDSMGRPFDLLPQQYGNSCFAACLSMAFRLIKGRRPPETLARFAVGLAGRGTSDAAQTSWDTEITLFVTQPPAIRELSLDFDSLPPSKVTLSGYCGTTRPGIAAAFWTAGGGHSVLCVGRIPSTTKVLFLDPWYGKQELEESTLPKYTAVDSLRTLGDVGSGQFSWNVLRCKPI